MTSETNEAKTAPPFPRSCACGESWSETEWAELPTDGRYFAGGEGWMELRTCVCGARLTIPCEAP